MKAIRIREKLVQLPRLGERALRALQTIKVKIRSVLVAGINILRETPKRIKSWLYSMARSMKQTMNQKLDRMKTRSPDTYRWTVYFARYGVVIGILWVFVNSPDIVRFFMAWFSE